MGTETWEEVLCGREERVRGEFFGLWQGKTKARSDCLHGGNRLWGCSVGPSAPLAQVDRDVLCVALSALGEPARDRQV